MRVLLQSGSIDTLSSILVNDISVYVSFSFMVIITSFAIYTLARILEWSSGRPLARVVQSSAFSALFVALVAAIALLLLLGVDFVQLFGKFMQPILSMV